MSELSVVSKNLGINVACRLKATCFGHNCEQTVSAPMYRFLPGALIILVFPVMVLQSYLQEVGMCRKNVVQNSEQKTFSEDDEEGA